MSQKSWVEYSVTGADEGLTVEQILKERLNVSGRMIQRLTRSKGILLNRKAPYLKRTVREGDLIRVRIADRSSAHQKEGGERPPVALPLSSVLYEDEHFLMVNKPAGMLVYPLEASQTGLTLVDAVAYYLLTRGEISRPHAVHRLDKDTSGAILLAKSGYAHQLADNMLREGQVEREYLAVLTGAIPDDQGTVSAPIRKDPRHRTKRQVHPEGDPAVTHFRVLARREEATLVRVRLETGRTHQIRVHFAHLGHPLAGDTLYGGSRTGIRRQALHAHFLSFLHPLSGVEIGVKAELPEDLSRFIEETFGLAPHKL